MAFKIKDLMQKVFQAPMGFAACQGQSGPPMTDTQANEPCCVPPEWAEEATDTQAGGPCCHKDKDKDKDRDENRLADLASLREELRRSLPQPPA